LPTIIAVHMRRSSGFSRHKRFQAADGLDRSGVLKTTANPPCVQLGHSLRDIGNQKDKVLLVSSNLMLTITAPNPDGLFTIYLVGLPIADC